MEKKHGAGFLHGDGTVSVLLAAVTIAFILVSGCFDLPAIGSFSNITTSSGGAATGRRCLRPAAGTAAPRDTPIISVTAAGGARKEMSMTLPPVNAAMPATRITTMAGATNARRDIQNTTPAQASAAWQGNPFYYDGACHQCAEGYGIYTTSDGHCCPQGYGYYYNGMCYNQLPGGGGGGSSTV